MELKLSDETLIGLKRLCNPSLVNTSNFQRVITDCTRASIGNVVENKSELEDTKSDVLKTAYAALAVLLSEAARHDLNGLKLKTILESYNYDTGRTVAIVNSYEEKKIGIQTRLLTIGTNLPHIVDIRWRLDYRVKSDYSCQPVLKPHVLVELITVTSFNTTETVRFICTSQNLRELIFSLKGAARHISKMINSAK